MTETSTFRGLPQRVGVVGAGTMGSGVAQTLAQAGYHVVVVEPDTAAADRARDAIRDGIRLAALLGRGGRTAGADAPGRVHWADRPEALHDTGFVVECVTERQELKERIFTELDRCTPPDTILASCTSAIPIASLAARTGRPGRVIGLHVMNPAPLKETVEVVRAPLTSDETLDVTARLLASIGKRPLVVQDGPGFVINRVMMLTIVEAAAAVSEGKADAATTDALFEQCLGQRMGPLRTADLIGLDNVDDTLTVLREHTGDSRYTPPPALRELVAAGHYGRKTGRGFHEYK
ncbi:3-hydroxyacyl-CoA dehydrogenase family protein [Streptomyces sp. NPDC006365]|uniref:3-hydroxyacyl-CoA dehydrogenase family protein n=1 Tax=Streptomyces sp. NPDC006365 TaxID=3364744 RepID=UPI003698BBA3